MRDVINDIVMRIVSMEQQAIFRLLMEGVPFDKLLLYRRLGVDGTEQGIMFEGKVAYNIKMEYPDEGTVVLLIGKYHTPFDYLNRL